MRNYPPASYIERVEIDGLFGVEDVDIRAGGEDPRLIVLYGGNGSGKTTILNIVRSLLSHEEGSGHRSRLARLPFSRASVTLKGGVVVEAKKKSDFSGSYHWAIKKQNGERISVYLPSRNDKVLVEYLDQAQAGNLFRISSELRAIVPNLIYLDDKRTFGGSSSESKVVNRRMPDGSYARMVIKRDSDHSTDEDPVAYGLSEVEDLIRREAILLSNRGNQDSQSVYLNLIKRLVSYPSIRVESADALKSKFSDLEKRASAISEYGISSPVNYEEIMGVLAGVPDDLANLAHVALGKV